MKNKRNIGVSLLACVMALGCGEAPKEKERVAEGPPNILFLYTDDQSYRDLHALGNYEVSTPAMDNLAAQGTTFTHAYNMGGWNGAICVASRAMIISGRSIWRAQEISRKFAKNLELEKTWPQLLKEKGYETYMTGKWHISAPADSIFDHVARTLRGMPFDTPEGYHRPKHVSDTLWQPWDTIHGGYWKGGIHWSELVRNDALGFIDRAADQQSPFFMYIAFNAPHDPRQSPREYVERYPLDSIAVPKSFLPKYPYAEAMGAGPGLRDEKLAPFPRTEHAVKVNRQEYYAITTHLDDQIGAILDHLRQKGLDHNTYVFLTSDHGLSVGEHGLLGKQNMYDHSVRVPLMVVGPNIPKGKKIANDVYLQDIMATTLELAGMDKPDYVEFNSLLPQIHGAGEGYDAIYGCYERGSQRMVRKGGYKLIAYPRANKMRLFDVENDSLEMNDLIDNDSHRERALTLLEDLQELQQKMGDTLDVSGLRNGLLD
ncbi:MAG: sulfatase-like hydrolase/transferase [Flavobacteriaceae bacterium]